MNILFVCTENLVRSPTAAALFEELQGEKSLHRTYAVGTASHARRRLTTRDLVWADLVAVMEDRHLAMIRTYWPSQVSKIVVLDVSDHFTPEDSTLREVLKPKIQVLLDRCNGRQGSIDGANTSI